MPRKKTHATVVRYHLPALVSMRSSAQRSDYLAGMIEAEGFEPAAAVLVAYCQHRPDGILVYTLLLQREYSYESDFADLLESFSAFFEAVLA